MPELNPIGGAIQHSTATFGNSDPSIASVAGGGYVVAWTAPDTDWNLGGMRQVDVDVRDSNDQSVGRFSIEVRFVSSFEGPYWAANPSVSAFQAGGFIVAYSDNSWVREQPRVFYKAYNQDLTIAFQGISAGPTQIDSDDRDIVTYGHDVAALAGGGAVLSYAAANEFETSPHAGDFTQRVSSSPGSPVPMGGDDNVVTSVAALGTGFVYVWSEPDLPFTDNSGDIFGQIVSPSGTVGASFQVNSITTGLQQISDKSVAALQSGGFVVVWTDASQSADDPTGTAIRARIFSAAGTPQGSEFLVNSDTNGSQADPAVAALPDGGFVVSWSGAHNQGSQGVLAQVFDAAGQKVGGQALIENSSGIASVAALANGEVVVAYTKGEHVYSERFYIGDPPGLQKTGTESADLLEGGAGRDELHGLGGNDQLYGFAAADDLRGGNGDDLLFGGDGDDLFVGGAGADIFTGGAGRDEVAYHTAGAGVEVDLSLDRGRGADAEGDRFGSIENLIGSGHDDQLTGDNDDNLIYGLGGNDRLWGGDRDDILIGGAGADILTGGVGLDSASYHISNSGVRIDLLLTTGRYGDAEGDRFGSIEDLIGSPFADELFGDNANNRIWGQVGNDDIQGGTGDDELHGGDGNDRLWSEQGGDILDGGAGVDFLAGGTGADRFVFAQVSDSAANLFDTIDDFNAAAGDKIDLRKIDASTISADDQAFTWIDTAGFSGVAGQLRQNQAGGDWYLVGDVDGNSVADFEIRLRVSVAEGDFYL